ncbi:MAG: hypothetical protein JSR49_15875, partial [Proteobacteria bacterium]|nr:hypothetical protein [Pseudomonadota bacterium]
MGDTQAFKQRAAHFRAGHGIFGHILFHDAWLRSTGTALLAALLTLAASFAPAPAQAGLSELLGMDGDSGSGKVAHLEFHLDDGNSGTTSVVWSPDGRFIATSGIQSMYLH